MYRRARLFIPALVLILILGTVAFAAPNDQSAPAFDQKVVARVDAGKAVEHIRYLSEVIGSRPGGLEKEWRGAKYIASVLESYGYRVELQPFEVADQYIGKVIFPDGAEWEMGSMRNTLITGDELVEGEVIYVEDGKDPEDFPENTPGKIVLMQRSGGSKDINIQVQNAVQAGAKGVILYSVVGYRGNYGSAFSYTLPQSADIPVLGGAYIHGVWLKEKLQNGEVTVKLKTEHYSDLQSLNVIATKPAKNGDSQAPVVIVGAHMDSVIGAPGANDNASGVASVLELARVLRGYNTDKEIRFIAFGAEERGLLGSRYYVSQLSGEEKERILCMFNADMVASPYEKARNLYAMTVDGNPNIVTEAAVAAGARLGNSSILPGRFGSSDHVPFYREGIPSALFIWMGIDSWDPLIYHIEKVYHTPQDNIEENISALRMQSALDIIGAAVFDVVRKEVPALENSAIRQ